MNLKAYTVRGNKRTPIPGRHKPQTSSALKSDIVFTFACCCLTFLLCPYSFLFLYAFSRRYFPCPCHLFLAFCLSSLSCTFCLLLCRTWSSFQLRRWHPCRILRRREWKKKCSVGRRKSFLTKKMITDLKVQSSYLRQSFVCRRRDCTFPLGCHSSFRTSAPCWREEPRPSLQTPRSVSGQTIPRRILTVIGEKIRSGRTHIWSGWRTSRRQFCIGLASGQLWDVRIVLFPMGWHTPDWAGQPDQSLNQ